VYIYQVAVDGDATEHHMVVPNSNLAQLVETRPLATSDSTGHFTIPYGLFGFDAPVVISSATGEAIDTTYISRTLSIVVAKHGYTTSEEAWTVPASEGIQRLFVLRK
jgi:hypothetical protein